MVPIDEDAVLQHAPAKVGKPRGGDSGGEVSVVPRGNPRGDAGAGDSRRRRFTVGGEADVAKLADDDDGREAAAALKLLQGTARAPKSAAERPSTSAGGGEAASGVSQQPPQPLPTAEPGVAPASGGGSGAPSAAANAAAEAGASGGALGASAAAGDGPATGRKRHNTIVGLFHNAIRRPEGEANGAPPHAAGAAAAAAAPATTASAVSTAHDAHDAAESLAAAGKPRSLRFTFNSNTTSSKPPDEIVAEVVAQATKQGLQYHLPAKYLIECTAPLRRPAAPGGEQVKFEIEICKLPRLRNLHGLRFKRLSGSSPDYKDTCEKLLESLAL
ncbi:MAG: KA1 domain/Ssp2 C-terminal domain-containing protein [Olpidium bornovanus]|uniref:non-specific serine/threonine protein kinase n=1 Tax=Olpidium bornovanus TaxID=278681 RepID=A0A8H8DLR1_9FUNG|nr:MAG: KA1 domain/Ssp2 C-terminal domain-containing protein [Olpidium bornovanus]